MTDRDSGAEDVEDFGSVLRDRIISIGSMSFRLRLITGFAIAAGVASFVTTAVQAFPIRFPMVQLYPVKGRLVETPVPVLVVTVIMLIFAWTYLLSGALHAHWAVRIGAIAVFSLSMWNEKLLAASVGLELPAALLFGSLWLYGLLTIAWDRTRLRRGHHDKLHVTRVTWTTFVVVLVIVTSIFALGIIGAAQRATTVLFTTWLSGYLTLMGVCLVPLLLLAGVDFAEWGEIISVHAGHFSKRFTPPTLASILALVLSLGIAVYYLWPLRHHPRALAETLLIGVAVAGVIVAAVWLSGASHRVRASNVPFLFVALAVAIYFAMALLGVAAPADAGRQIVQNGAGIFGPFSYSGTPPFSLEQPELWESFVDQEEGKQGSKFTQVHIDGAASGDHGAVYILAFPVALVSDSTVAVADVLQGLEGPGNALSGQVSHLASGSRDHGWDRLEVTTTSASPGTHLDRVRLWTRVTSGHVWVIVGVAEQASFANEGATFDAMVATWVPHAGGAPAARAVTPTAPTGIDRALTLMAGTMLLAAIVGLLLTRRGLGGRFSGAISTGSLYLFVVATLTIGFALGSVVSTLSGSDHEWLSVFHLPGVQWVIALATVVVVVAASRPRWRGLRRFIGPLVSLDLALLFVALMYQLYSSSQKVAQFSIAQAVVLLIAFALDVILSGEPITNAHSTALPRHARVMMFFGYILMGSALVLYFSSLHFQSTGGPVASQFEEGFFPQSGLLIFGIPILLTIFVLKVLRSPVSVQEEGI